MFKAKLGFLLIFLNLSLSSCIPQHHIIDEIELPQILGIDIDGDQFTGTILVPAYKEQGKTEFKQLNAVTSSSYDIIPQINFKTKHQVENGQLGAVLLGSEFAERGIGDFLQNFTRDPKIPAKLQIGVSGGSASELLGIIKESGEPFFLSYMIDQSIHSGNLPKINLHESLFNYYGEGRDMLLPHFHIGQGEINIDGLALFKGDKQITTIDIKESFLLKLLLENSKNGQYMFPFKEGNDTRKDFLLLKIKKSTVSRTVSTGEKSSPSISFKIAMKVAIENSPTSVSLTSSRQVQQLEKKMGLYFEAEMLKLLSFCQEKNVDPIGMGDSVRMKKKDWNTKNFSKVKTKLNVHVDIIEAGTTE